MVLKDTLETFGAPEIINSDQGSQYTSFSWTRAFEECNFKISMDGKGRATDNIWIERLWKTIKYNYLTFNLAETGMEQYRNMDYWVNYYNNKKHQANGLKPNVAHAVFNDHSLAS